MEILKIDESLCLQSSKNAGWVTQIGFAAQCGKADGNLVLQCDGSVESVGNEKRL